MNLDAEIEKRVRDAIAAERERTQRCLRRALDWGVRDPNPFQTESPYLVLENFHKRLTQGDEDGELFTRFKCPSCRSRDNSVVVLEMSDSKGTCSVCTNRWDRDELGEPLP